MTPTPWVRADGARVTSGDDASMGTAPGCPSADALLAWAEARPESRADASLRVHLSECERCRESLGFVGGASVTVPDASSEALQPLEPGDTLGPYAIRATLGAGGMGDVYRALDPRLGREVALKVLREAPAGRGWLDEGRALARLRHPAVVTVFEAGEAQGRHFLAMELVQGTDFRTWLAAKPRSVAAKLQVLLAAADGLAAAHALSLVHCDFKPKNLLVDREGKARVVDFGLARRAGRPPAVGPSGREGTPPYMAPEQLAGEAVGPAADQFAFCVTLFEAFTGERLRTRTVAADEAGTPELEKVIGHVPTWLRPVLQRGLATDPRQRYPSMKALARSLERRSPPWRARRRRWVLAGVATVALTMVISLGAGRALFRPDCLGAPPALDALWSKERSAKLLATLGDGQGWHRALAGAVQRYQSTWRAMRADGCLAAEARGTTSRATVDEQAACLESHLRRSTAVLDAIAETPGADGSLARTALDGLEQCSLAVVARRRGLPAEAHGAQPGLEARLVQAKTAHTLGRFSQAVALLDPLVREAAAAPELEGLARLELVTLRGGLAARDANARLADIEDAWNFALARGDEDLAAMVATRAAMTCSEVLGRRDEARRWQRQARSLLGRLMLPEQSGRIDLVEGALLSREGKAQAAALAFARALHAFPDERFAEERVRALMGSCITERVLGRFDVALPRCLEAEAVSARLLGPQSLQHAGALSNTGALYEMQRKFPEAIERFERATELWSRVGTPEQLTRGRHNLAVAYANMGDLERAERTLRQVVQETKARFGSGDVQLAYPLAALGEVVLWRGDFEEAFELARESCRIAGAKHDLDCGATQVTALLGLKRIAEAQRLAAAERERLKDGGAPARRFATDVAAGEAHLAANEPARARAVLEPWLKDAAEPALDVRTRARLRLALARALVSADSARARTLEREGADLLSPLGLGAPLSASATRR